MGDEADSQDEYLNERFERTGVWADISNAIVHQDYIGWLADEYYVMRSLSVLMDEGMFKLDKDWLRGKREDMRKLKEQKDMKLKTELIPSPLWNINLREMVSRSDWNKIRGKAYEAARHMCEICGDVPEKVLHCHEIWVYDEEEHIQYLRGVCALCVLCHSVKHMGRTTEKAKLGEADLDQVIEHFKKVNSCSQEEYCKHKEENFQQWKERSLYEWTTDWGIYKQMVIDYKEKKLLDEDTYVADVVDGVWVWLPGGIKDVRSVYAQEGKDSHWFDEHHGKWLIFDDHEELKLLDLELVAGGYVGALIDNVKYSRIPLPGEDECVMCVYCDDEDRERVRNILTELGVNKKMWKYDKESVRDWKPGGRLYRQHRSLGVG